MLGAPFVPETTMKAREFFPIISLVLYCTHLICCFAELFTIPTSYFVLQQQGYMQSTWMDTKYSDFFACWFSTPILPGSPLPCTLEVLKTDAA